MDSPVDVGQHPVEHNRVEFPGYYAHQAVVPGHQAFDLEVVIFHGHCHVAEMVEHDRVMKNA
jgi:hypothetical protein